MSVYHTSRFPLSTAAEALLILNVAFNGNTIPLLPKRLRPVPQRPIPLPRNVEVPCTPIRHVPNLPHKTIIRVQFSA